MARVTIREIARRSGVSKGAVSYALNGQPGVSESTRARVLKVAAELNWAPNSAARMLSGARTDTFGLVLARHPATLSYEPFYMEFIGGVESVLTTKSYGLLLQVVPDIAAEIATYRKWSSERRVDAVIVVDVRVDDPRIPLLEELELPAVVVADPSLAGGLAGVGTDDASAAEQAVRHLAGLGHRTLGRVAGLRELGHIRIRDEAFAAAAQRSGLRMHTVHTDFSGDGGAEATRTLLAEQERPTAIVYDNDLMAVAGLSAISELGMSVPGDVSLVAWDDSTLCRITHPSLTAMGHDVVAYGAAVAERLFGLLAGAGATADLVGAPALRVRGSSAPPRG
ncbi:LacI family DNA-binding transcriptional regulator [Pseudonocardia nigra]|uniref:LacI family DNA-binding transcriptional regulator n=1 Tax=Pseudonocardia nigra TaxID=1921578 RepID=UPI001C5DC79C|nr:LacI family DNA-binding transcriptional regulator [Pseudonocardia nigra]